MGKITPFIWFDNQAEEAMNLYLSLFEKARVTNISHYGEAWPELNGKLMTATFELEGQEFMILNGGPHYRPSPGVSFYVNCETQDEVDRLWEKLSDGGETMQCGWLTDRFGVTWQIIPSILGELLQDPAKSARVTRAMLKMVKLDIQGLLRAAEEPEQ